MNTTEYFDMLRKMAQQQSNQVSPPVAKTDIPTPPEAKNKSVKDDQRGSFFGS